jgi:exodeoxyribonuclease VII large subunit
MDNKFTLFELNKKIKDALTNELPGTVWVKAEISEMKENRSGHCYLELVEREGNQTIARARAIIWSYTYRMLKPYFESATGRLFTEGLKIMVLVTVEFHPVYGLSLNISDIEPAYTVGDIALQRKEIIDRLKAENVFNMNKEVPLPLVPQKIAVISSKTAAGYQDFISHLENNPAGYKFRITLFEAYMQGEEAAGSVIHALEEIFKYEEFFDAVAIIRGGGAAADLGCFDNYELALNVTQFPLPVITGIGHEKDDTILDMVAHTRLKTPTAVAEFFIAGADRFYDKLMELKERMRNITDIALDSRYSNLNSYVNDLYNFVFRFIGYKNDYLLRKSNKLQSEIKQFSFNKNYSLINMKHRLHSAVSALSSEYKTMLTRKRDRLTGTVKEYIVKKHTFCSEFAEDLNQNTKRFIAKENERINANERSVRLLNPANVLKRGYTITISGNKIVKSAKQLHIEDEIETRFSDGKVKSKIIKN